MSEWEQLARRLGRGGKWGYYWVSGQGHTASIWWPVERRPPPPAGADVFFGVHPTTQIPPSNSRGERRAPAHVRSQIPYIAAINCLFAEYDAKHFLGGKVDALAHIMALPELPSVLIDSGGGYHAYWLLERPWLLRTEQDRVRARRVQFDWIVYVGSDPGAKDLTRVLRVPGTLNCKPCYAPDFPTVSFVRACFNHLYAREALEARLPAQAEQQPLPIFFPPGSNDAAADFWVQRALGRVAPGTRHGRNSTGFWLGCRLRDAGVSHMEAEAAMRRYAAQVPRGDHPYEAREALHSLASAYARPTSVSSVYADEPYAFYAEPSPANDKLARALRRRDPMPRAEALALLDAAEALEKWELLELLKQALLPREALAPPF